MKSFRFIDKEKFMLNRVCLPNKSQHTENKLLKEINADIIIRN